MIRIFIADDHAIIRKGLKQILSETSDMIAAEEAGDGAEALRKIYTNNYDYDVILLDISMPGLDGLEILRQVKRKKPHLPVLMLSVYPEEQYAIRSLRAGASGYLTKESAPHELIEAIRKISKGGKFVTATLAEKLIAELDIYVERPTHEKLSDREYQVMCMSARGKTLKEIAHELSLSVQTVSTYKKRILEKMQMNSFAEVIRYAVQYRLIE
jgi:DNA-binding NarL/FixJ family response regulator